MHVMMYVCVWRVARRDKKESNKVRKTKEIRKEKKRKGEIKDRTFSKLGRRKLTTPKKQRAEHSKTRRQLYADMRCLGIGLMDVGAWISRGWGRADALDTNK